MYFSFYLASGGMENNIPFLFEERGMVDSLYGIFLSLLNISEVILPLVIVFLSKKFSPTVVGYFSLIAGIIAAILISIMRFNLVIFIGLFIVYCIRIVFNFSIGNSINLAIPSKERSEYFAVRDIFLYGAIAISTLISSWIIKVSCIEYSYGILGIGFLLTIFFSLRGKKWIEKEAEEERFRLKDYV